MQYLLVFWENRNTLHGSATAENPMANIKGQFKKTN